MPTENPSAPITKPADHSLQVYTARVNYGGADRFDVTRGSGGAQGTVFAPSLALLCPMLEVRATLKALFVAGGPQTTDRLLVLQNHLWAVYSAAYRAEMRLSYRAKPEAWSALLARDEVTLCCYCTDPDACHRALLAKILEALGATVCGERPTPIAAGRTVVAGSSKPCPVQPPDAK